jgi:hypothetical protein
MIEGMNSTSSATKAPARARVGMTPQLWLWALAVPAIAVSADQLMRHAELPSTARVLLAFSPLVPGAIFLRVQARVLARADELAVRIANEAYAFVFYALIGLFICVDLLENSGILAGFGWNTLRLTVAMFVLMIIGTLISNRRYR